MFRTIPAFLVAASALTLATFARADGPRVVVDTLPLQSLVARVMHGAGTPDLLIAPGMSPHDFALRPADATRLSQTDVLIWTGPSLVPWLADAAPTLLPQAAMLALLESPGWQPLPQRRDADFTADAARIETPASPDAGSIDPHAWLDPGVAADWASLIAGYLSVRDPDNADLYAANAADLRRDLAALDAEIAGLLAGARGGFLVPHDAFQYFENRYGLPAFGAIMLSDASQPGLAHLSDLRAAVQSGAITCILTDPETNPAYAEQLAAGTDVRIARVDPDGILLPPGPDLYPLMLRAMAENLAACLAPR